jgi:hypothetical protein
VNRLRADYDKLTLGDDVEAEALRVRAVELHALICQTQRNQDRADGVAGSSPLRLGGDARMLREVRSLRRVLENMLDSYRAVVSILLLLARASLTPRRTASSLWPRLTRRMRKRTTSPGSPRRGAFASHASRQHHLSEAHQL